MLIAITDNDDQKYPTSKDIRRTAFDDAKVSAQEGRAKTFFGLPGPIVTGSD